jgi:tryptophan synthase beta chain
MATRTEAPSLPDASGHFGPYGGRFVPETLVLALDELTEAYEKAQADPAFRAELEATLRDFAGRPTPLFEAKRFSEKCGCRVLLKREDLLHTGAHKINNTIGQCLLTKRGQATRDRGTGNNQPAWPPPPRPRASGSSARVLGSQDA